jgi:hypothetical protein
VVQEGSRPRHDWRAQSPTLACCVGDAVVPPSLVDKLYLQVSSDDAAGAAAELDRHMRPHLTPSAPIPKRHSNPTESNAKEMRSFLRNTTDKAIFDPLQPVQMRGVDLNEVTTPRTFVYHFDHPSSWTSMHRPGIAPVIGDRIILDGTTMEELERYHLATLKPAVAAANADRRQAAEQEEAARKRAQVAAEAHGTTNADIASRLRFD